MRLAVVTTAFPNPPVNGVTIPAFHLCRELVAAGHEILLVHYGDVGDLPFEAKQATLDASQLRGLGRASLRPLFARRFVTASTERAFSSAIASFAPDAIIAHRIHTAELVAGVDLPRALIVQDVVSAKLATDLTENRFDLRRTFLKPNRRMVERYERQVFPLFNHHYVVTAGEADAFASVLPGRQATVLPNGVTIPPEVVRSMVPGTPTLGYLGSISNPRNELAVWHLATEVFPAVRDQIDGPLSLRIIGNAPSDRLVALASVDTSITLTGRVDDIASELAKVSCIVNLQAKGSGIKNSVLEGLAMRRPSVLSPIAAQGIDVDADVHYLEATGTDDAVAKTLSLLKDPTLAATLGHAAGSLVEGSYSWGQYARTIVEDLHNDTA